MAREIKFRFWVKNALKMADWEMAKKDCDGLSVFDLEGFIPMQYLNLNGKDGVNIYESDIVRYPDMHKVAILTKYHRFSITDEEKESCYMVAEVCFFDGSIWIKNNRSIFSLTYAMVPSGNPHLPSLLPSSIEVIGNIYETPELLTP